MPVSAMASVQPVTTPSRASSSCGVRPASSTSSTPAGRQAAGSPDGTTRRRAPALVADLADGSADLTAADAPHLGLVVGEAPAQQLDERLAVRCSSVSVGALDGLGRRRGAQRRADAPEDQLTRAVHGSTTP